MRIGELSRRTGIATSRIRFYEKHAVLPKPGRGENGYREYPETAVKTLDLIDGAQRLGFSLSEIRAGLSGSAPNFPSDADLIQALRSKLADIDQHMKEVRGRRRQIVELLKEIEDPNGSEKTRDKVFKGKTPPARGGALAGPQLTSSANGRRAR